MKSSRRHDLKHDQVADSLGTIWEWILLHRVKVILVFVGLSVAVGVIAFLYAAAAMERDAANERLAQVEMTAWDIMAAREKDEEKAMLLSGKAISEYRDIAREFPAGVAAARALFRAGKLLHDERRCEDAAKAFRQAIAKAPDHPGLQRMATENLAVTLEEAGQYSQALAEYRRLAEGTGPRLRAKVYWDMGRCHEEMKDVAKAQDAYATAVRTSPDSMWAKQALSRSRALSEPKPKPKAKKALTTKPTDAKKSAKDKASAPSAGGGGGKAQPKPKTKDAGSGAKAKDAAKPSDK